MVEERLHKIMARAGIASRRRSEEMILRGMVKVDGRVVRELGFKVDPEASRIEAAGVLLDPVQKKIYLALNKPAGYLTTVTDPFGRPTVMDLLAESGRFQDRRLFPVGRLDLNTEGLLILTNDGELADLLMHPRHKVPKTYLVKVQGNPRSKTVEQIRSGINLKDGVTLPAKVELKSRRRGKTVFEMVIKEGRKRQIRRMWAAVGHPVVSLKRTAIGPIELGDLKTGRVRRLTFSEAAALKKAATGRSARRG